MYVSWFALDFLKVKSWYCKKDEKDVWKNVWHKNSVYKDWFYEKSIWSIKSITRQGQVRNNSYIIVLIQSKVYSDPMQSQSGQFIPSKSLRAIKSLSAILWHNSQWFCFLQAFELQRIIFNSE